MGKIYTRAFKTHVYILYTYVGQKSTCVYSLHTLEHNILLCFYDSCSICAHSVMTYSHFNDVLTRAVCPCENHDVLPPSHRVDLLTCEERNSLKGFLLTILPGEDSRPRL